MSDLAPPVSLLGAPTAHNGRLYPVNLDLNGRRALVVGGGHVAVGKVAGLLRAGAQVTVVAPEAVAEIAEDPDVRWHARAYRRGEVASYRLAIAATDDPAVNAQVARDGESANVAVNSVDDPANCSFVLPAVWRAGDLQITISTNGRSPAFAKWLRRQFDEQFGAAHLRLLDLLSDVRDEAKQRWGTSMVPGWDEALDDGLYDLVAAGQLDEARRLLRRSIGLESVATEGEPA